MGNVPTARAEKGRVRTGGAFLLLHGCALSEAIAKARGDPAGRRETGRRWQRAPAGSQSSAGELILVYNIAVLIVVQQSVFKYGYKDAENPEKMG